MFDDEHGVASVYEAVKHVEELLNIMASSYLFTSESVSEGHPDKICDQISDAVLDALIETDPNSRVACETLVKTDLVVVAGEITSLSELDVDALVRKTVIEIGYDSDELGFNGHNCRIMNELTAQSADIAQGVDRAKKEDQGAGDQGLMFGYASNETDELMPAPIVYAHRLVQRQAQVRKSGELPWLRPDAKSQVTFRYENDKPVAVEAVVLSTQHDPDVSQQDLADHQTDHSGVHAGARDEVSHQSNRPVRDRRSGG